MRTSRSIWITGAAIAVAGALGSAAAAGVGGGGAQAGSLPRLLEVPPRQSSSPVARFSFDGRARRFECRLDDGPATPCASPVEYRLGDGTHRFSVADRGREAHYAWAVDTVAPDPPRFVEAPPLVTRSTQVRFVAEPGSRVRCALDGVPARCGRVFTVGEGEHRFTATTLDAAGNRSADAVHAWRVDMTPPGAPVLADGGPPFTFTGEADATFECAFDGGPALPCASPHTYADPLPGGEHTFAVRARDAAGNVGPAASARWTVDAEPYRSAVLASAPAGYWRLGETEWGAAGAVTGAPGAYTGGVTLGAEGAVPGDPAAGFDGTSGEILLPGPTLRASGTVSGWFRYSGIAALRDNTAGNGWILGLNATGGRYACRAGSGSRQAVSAVPIATLADDWHHLAMTKNGGVVGCYLDGRLVASIDRVPDANSEGAWHVMNNGAVSEQYSRGEADEIAIHERALSAAEIEALYRAGRPS